MLRYNLSMFQTGFKSLHCTLRDRPMTLLFLHNPCCSHPSETLLIGVNQPPCLIDEPSNKIRRTRVKTLDCVFLCFHKVGLGLLTITIFTPSPVLEYNIT